MSKQDAKCDPTIYYIVHDDRIYTRKLHFTIEFRDGGEWVIIGQPYDGDHGPDGVNTLAVPVDALRQFLFQHDSSCGKTSAMLTGETEEETRSLAALKWLAKNECELIPALDNSGKLYWRVWRDGNSLGDGDCPLEAIELAMRASLKIKRNCDQREQRSQ